MERILYLRTWQGVKELSIDYLIDKSGCFIFQNRHRHPKGYNYIVRNGERTTLHRYIYELVYGRLLCPRIIVRHKCDNPSCINPDHLLIGTDADNTQDKINRGRLRVPYGENHCFAKLNEFTVKSLRKRWKKEKFNIRGLAKELKIDKKTLTNVIKGKTWKHVK